MVVSTGISIRPLVCSLCGFVAADHVEVDHGAGGIERTQRMSRHVKRAEQAALFSGENNEQDGTLWLLRIGREGVSEFDNTDRARTVVVGAVPDLFPAGAIVIVMRAYDQGLGA